MPPRRSLHALLALAVALSGATGRRVDAQTERASAVAHPDVGRGALGPAAEYTPEQVVSIQLGALRANDVPVRDAGIATAFAFSTSTNRESMGPLDRFVELVKGPSYRPLVRHLRAEAGEMRRFGDEAEQQVTVTSADGERVSYLFTLRRQPAGTPHAGCWLTDAVTRVPTLRRPGRAPMRSVATRG